MKFLFIFHKVKCGFLLTCPIKMGNFDGLVDLFNLSLNFDKSPFPYEFNRKFSYVPFPLS